ncbi:hypothetical protein [Hydrogenophaga sp.]|uniref:hypothetical protein n=1 Tax=Hydrogenophaga sp. TaxID=1904254 RepID=UPI002FC5FAC2
MKVLEKTADIGVEKVKGHGTRWPLESHGTSLWTSPVKEVDDGRAHRDTWIASQEKSRGPKAAAFERSA